MGISFVTREKIHIVNEALEKYYKGLELQLIKDHKKALETKAKTGEDYFNKNFQPLLQLTEKELLDILIGDFEVEKTKEEKLFSYWKDHQKIADKDQQIHSLGVVDGIYKTLDILGISIEGINC